MYFNKNRVGQEQGEVNIPFVRNGSNISEKNNIQFVPGLTEHPEKDGKTGVRALCILPHSGMIVAFY